MTADQDRRRKPAIPEDGDSRLVPARTELGEGRLTDARQGPEAAESVRGDAGDDPAIARQESIRREPS